jgi:hypothetical protein
LITEEPKLVEKKFLSFPVKDQPLTF